LLHTDLLACCCDATQVARQEYISGKVIDNVEDEDDDALNTKTNFEVPEFRVDVTDIDPM
jgi:activator of HSP90 ATPase